MRSTKQRQSASLGYEFTLETAEGRPVIRARDNHPKTGMKVTLTFPATGDATDIERFKQRVAQIILKQRAKRQGTA